MVLAAQGILKSGLHFNFILTLLMMNLHWGWMSLGTDTRSIVIIRNSALFILPLPLNAYPSVMVPPGDRNWFTK